MRIKFSSWTSPADVNKPLFSENVVVEGLNRNQSAKNLQSNETPATSTSPDPKPQLGSIEILQVLAGELVQKIDNIRLEHHDFLYELIHFRHEIGTNHDLIWYHTVRPLLSIKTRRTRVKRLEPEPAESMTSPCALYLNSYSPFGLHISQNVKTNLESSDIGSTSQQPRGQVQRKRSQCSHKTQRRKGF